MIEFIIEKNRQLQSDDDAERSLGSEIDANVATAFYLKRILIRL